MIMKTYKNLWKDFIACENFELAQKKAVRSRRKSAATAQFLENADEYMDILYRQLKEGLYKTSDYKTFWVFEPKRRQICMLPLYPDHIVHHALINILGPIWTKLFISDTYACIPGRGLHAASKRCAQMVRKNKYVMRCDIRKFYQNIRHDIMINIIKRKISDRQILGVLGEIIQSTSGECGLPIGVLTSQWLGNLYMNDVDMFIKHNLHVRHYIRYCDDFCLFSNNRYDLEIWRAELKKYLQKNLKLCFSRCIIQSTDCGVDFIGYRHFKKFIILTRPAARKIKSRMTSIIRTGVMSPRVRSQLCSYNGWLKAGCMHNFRLCLIRSVAINTPFHKFLCKYFYDTKK